MNVLDLVKATLACGGLAFLIYSFPVIGQVTLITILSLLWMGYAHRTITYLRRRRARNTRPVQSAQLT